MRYLRAAIVAAIATAALSVPSTALAQIESLSISDARLGPEGASVTVTMTYQCEVGWNAAFGDVEIAQSTGFRLVQGFGYFENEFPGVPCTGSPETQEIVVHSDGPFAFKQGRATASFSFAVYNPTTDELVSENGGPVTIRITRK
jgi:hypothetical protein